jgi:hypothetical protein
MEKVGWVQNYSLYMEIFYSHESRRSIMPWCITNGIEYLFGIVRSGEVYHACRLDTAIAFDKDFKDTKKLKTILKVLTFQVRISESY